MYQLHPLCTLFPRLDGGEFSALVADIRANGLRQPIVLHDGMILDGGNRYRACEEAGVEPAFVEFDGESIVAFVLSANLHRRHMTPGQQAAIVASAQDWAKAQGRGGDRKSDQSASLHFDSVEQRAAESGASVRTQKMADKVARADPELSRKVAHGEVTLPAAVEKLTGKRPGKKSPKKAATKDPLAVATARIAELETELTEAREELAEARDNMAVMADELAAYKRAADPDHAKKFLQQQGYVSTLERTRDEWMTKCSALTREVKALQRKLGRAA